MKFEFRFLSGTRAGQQQLIEAASVRLGRHPDNDVPFDVQQDLQVSGHHAQIRQEADGIYLCDLSSSNGTFIGQERVVRYRMGPTQEVRFGAEGPRVLITMLEDQPEHHSLPIAPAAIAPAAIAPAAIAPAAIAPAAIAPAAIAPAAIAPAAIAPAAIAPAAIAPAPRSPKPRPQGSSPRRGSKAKVPSRRGRGGWLITLILLMLVGAPAAVFWFQPGFLFGDESDDDSTTSEGITDVGSIPMIIPQPAAPTVINVPYTEVQSTVNAAGGELVAKGGLTLSVPPGAVAEETRLVVRQVDGPFPSTAPRRRPGALALGPVFDLGPEGMSFRRPVQVTLKFDPARLPPGTKTNQIRLAYFNGEKWVFVRAAVDRSHHTVTASLTSFPGLALTTVAIIATNVLIYGYLAWKGHRYLQNPSEMTRSDQVADGTANKWISSDDPAVQQHARIAMLQIEGRNEMHPLDDPDLGKWIESTVKSNKRVSIVFPGSPTGISRPDFDQGKGSNWQEPGDFFTKGSAMGPLHGDCTDITNAMVSVMQARGFAARSVYGYGNGNKDQPHVWGEVVIDGQPYIVDEMGALLPYHREGNTITFLYANNREDVINQKYEVPSDPRDPHYKSTWDGKIQEKFDPDWPKRYAKVKKQERDKGQEGRGGTTAEDDSGGSPFGAALDTIQKTNKAVDRHIQGQLKKR